jgi:hypothetical protein
MRLSSMADYAVVTMSAAARHCGGRAFPPRNWPRKPACPRPPCKSWSAAYEHGWSSDIEQEYGPKGLSEDTVRYISAKKGEPEWMLEWRLKAYRHWLTMESPDWAKLNVPPIDYQDAYYYAAPKAKPKLASAR